MARSSTARVHDARGRVPEGKLLEHALATPPALPLRRNGFDLIAEVKLRSPASGNLSEPSFDLSRQLSAYAAGGAAAVSVLTEPEQFKGTLEHLERASQELRAVGVPTMRKDFLTDPYQVIEARAAGAAGVLVIMTMLDDATVRGLLECAHELGLFVLLEAFDRDDLERIALLRGSPAAQHLLVGVNCRDLKTLAVRFEHFADVAPHLPSAWPLVAESGIATLEQVRTVVDLGYRLVLAGSALMQAADPAAEMHAWLAAGRQRVRELEACS